MQTLRLILAIIFPLLSLAFIHKNHAKHLKLSTSSTGKISSAVNYNIFVKSHQTQLTLYSKVEDKKDVEKSTEPSAFDRVASTGLAGVLAIALAESIFWALGMPLAELWVYFTTGELIDLTTQDGQLQAAGFTFVSSINCSLYFVL